MVAATAAASICLYLMVNYLLLGVFDYFIRYKRKRVQFFTERKLSIIEDVKENEKFKVAKEIIEKYGTEEERRQLLGGGPDSKEAKSQVDSSAENQMELETADAQKQGTPNQPRVPKLYENSVGRFSYRTPVRPFVEQSHTPIDRVLDYVMGENISNRFKLCSFIENNFYILKLKICPNLCKLPSSQWNGPSGRV
jgi:hypothetical protein